MEAIKAANGRFYLNVGCGRHFSLEWTNLDLATRQNVIAHDLRHPLPFKDGIFDAVYSSHVLEHLTQPQGVLFLREQFRVLKPGGVCRVVVPDLEKNCRDYLQQLEKAESDPSTEQLQDYQWTVFQLIDQLTRDECGGEMLKAIRAGNYRPEFIQTRFGDEFLFFIRKLEKNRSQKGRAWIMAMLPEGLIKILRRILQGSQDPRRQGEVHRWMYDRLSLRLLLTKLGFLNFRVVTHLESTIPDWHIYNLDLSQNGVGARKPDSLFVEAIKPQ